MLRWLAPLVMLLGGMASRQQVDKMEMMSNMAVCHLTAKWYSHAFSSMSPMTAAMPLSDKAMFVLNGNPLMGAEETVHAWGQEGSPFPVAHMEVLNVYCGDNSAAFEVVTFDKMHNIRTAGVDIVRWNDRTEVTSIEMNSFGPMISKMIVEWAMNSMNMGGGTGGDGMNGGGGMTTPYMGGGGGMTTDGGSMGGGGMTTGGMGGGGMTTDKMGGGMTTGGMGGGGMTTDRGGGGGMTTDGTGGVMPTTRPASEMPTTGGSMGGVTTPDLGGGGFPFP